MSGTGDEPGTGRIHRRDEAHGDNYPLTCRKKPKKAERVPKGAATHVAAGAPSQAQPENPLVHCGDVVRLIKSFADNNSDFLFFAGVSRQWRQAWTPSNGQNAPSDNRTAVRVAVESVPRLQWARDCGCPWNVMTAIHAASGGHLAVLQWAQSEGCRMDKRVCAAAAATGQLEVLTWLRNVGCPWDEEVRF